ncbi:hypothetical protein AS9A_0963 [Hoyosella subflava DQS3-9A1]|uniref:Uncharacterized protein n=1 Tax=Hoyosella subflava (strain DSM 45089 / JCM 17490 / NBRC 109087 / DQS3-9A1) TaxID=443218 RepID=F6EPI2_HOYSD|nr:hypothetical protein AS9A_0963 [Hoyosella subflava DQS3-9A1]
MGEEHLLRLGTRPEAGVCLDCAQHLHRRAKELADRQRPFPTPASIVRAATRSVRDAVLSRGWHDHPAVGSALRRIDRFLP